MDYLREIKGENLVIIPKLLFLKMCYASNNAHIIE